MRSLIIATLIASASLVSFANVQSVSAETFEKNVFETPKISILDAFDIMDLDNDYVVDTIEYNNAIERWKNLNLGGYNFRGMDLDGNGIITRQEAKKVTPEQASNSVVTIVEEDAETIIVYEINGKTYSEAEFEELNKEGKYKILDAPLSSSSEPVPSEVDDIVETVSEPETIEKNIDEVIKE